jgi:hypothetical protein
MANVLVDTALELAPFLPGLGGPQVTIPKLGTTLLAELLQSSAED